LYKTLDDLQSEEELINFTAELKDRFGDIPLKAVALLNTIRMRWLAREIGLEKLVLKSGKMIGYFVKQQDSPYYQSEKFSKVIDFVKRYPNAGKMYEKEGTLRISFNHIETMDKALKVLRGMHGDE
jgi:transcription-repair coupling factor (superfamily II helicase)